MIKTFMDSLARGIGLATPGVVIVAAAYYRNQHLSRMENLMVAGILALWVFIFIGMSVFHRRLWPRFGRLACAAFIAFAILVCVGRMANLFGLLTTDGQRILNTGGAVFLSVLLTYFVCWKPYLSKSIFLMLFPETKPDD